MIRPGSTSARVLALALLGAVVVAVLGATALVAGRVAERDELIRDRQERLVRLHRLGADVAPLEKAIARLESDDARSELVLVAPSDRVATAELQQRLKAIVTRNGGTLTSARVLESEVVATLRRVGLEVRASLGTAGLRDTLHELESGAPLLLVENVTIVARRTARRRRTASRSAPLDVRFRLVGFMSVDATEQASSG